MAIIFFGFGTIAIFALVAPMVVISKSPEHDCQIGLPEKALITLLTYDTVVNVGLTALYLVMASKNCPRLSWASGSRLVLRALPCKASGPLPSLANVTEHFMAKSVLACFAIILATVGNLVALIVLRGHEEAWICLTVCSADGSYPGIRWIPDHHLEPKEAN